MLVAVTSVSASAATLDDLEAELRTISGQAFILSLREGGSGAEQFGPYVFYAPLSALWELETETLADANGARPSRAGTLWRVAGAPGDRLEIRWNDGPRVALAVAPAIPTISVSPEQHGLAGAYEQLLARPLAGSIAGLPPGSQFRADGTVRLPAAATGRVRWQQQAATIEVWRGASEIVTVEPIETFLGALGDAGSGQ